MGYMMNFIVYLLAMLGIIVLALFVYKKFNVGSFSSKNNHSLKVEDALNLTARKTLYVIRNGNERFLIAADTDRTTLISKLEDNNDYVIENNNRRVANKNVDLSERGVRMQDNIAPIRKPIMKEIKNKLNF